MSNFSIIKFCRKILFERKAVVLIIIISSISISAFTAMIPTAISDCVSSKSILYPALVLSLCYLVRAVGKLVRNHLSASLGTDVVMALRLYCVDKFIKANTVSSKDAYTLITYDIEKVSNIISQQTLIFLEDLIVLLITLITVAFDNIVILFILLLEVAVIVAISLKYSSAAKAVTNVQRESIGRVTDIIHEATVVQKLIRSFNIEKQYINQFENANSDNTKANLTGAKYNRFYSVSLEAILLAAILACMTFITLGRDASAAELVKYYGYMTLLFNTSRSFSGVISLYVNSKQSIIRIKKALAEERANKTAAVSYSDGDTIICQGKNGKAYTFERGKMTCITGRCGSGKSTLLGSILENGNEFYDVFLPKENNKVGISFQKCVFFDDTVEGNISLGRACADAWRDEIYSHFYVDEIITAYQGKSINGDDVVLSGGEQQRICLTRMMYSNPDIILIDDSITAIDTKRRNEILDYLLPMNAGRFIIIVTNYPDVISRADTVIEV